MAASDSSGAPAPASKRSPWLKVILAVSVIAAFTANGVDAKNLHPRMSYEEKPHSTANAKQAASLQAGAVKLSAGQYTFTNVETGHSLTYTASNENIVPATGKGTAIAIKQHPNKKTRWLQLHLQGGKTKCLSSQWGGGGDAAAVAYQCNNSGLEKTKQWWIVVPYGQTAVKANTHSAANGLLLAQQADSDKLHRRGDGDGEDDEDAAIDEAWEDELEEEEEEEEEESLRLVKRKKHHKKTKKTTKLNKGKSDGKHYYLIPTDHLMDTAAVALTGNRIKTGSALSTKLRTLKTGNKAQLWKITKH